MNASTSNTVTNKNEFKQRHVKEKFLDYMGRIKDRKENPVQCTDLTNAFPIQSIPGVPLSALSVPRCVAKMEMHTIKIQQMKGR